ncbi:MAG: ATP-binding protein [Desulfobacteraceae bacterium]|nr:ATP-binding protein [Desulfobacteraceae bacterium]
MADAVFCPDQGPTRPLSIKRQLQWLFFWRVMVLTLLLGISLLLQEQEHQLSLPSIHRTGYFISCVYLLTIGSSFLLNRISCYQRFAYLQLLLDAALTTVLVLFSGGSESIFFVVYYFPIIAAGYILYRQGGLILAAASTLLFGLALFIQYTGFNLGDLLRTGSGQLPDPIPFIHHFSIPSLTFFLVAVLSSLLSERLRMIEAALSRTTLDYDRLSLLYKQIFDDITSGIITVDNQGRITSFNRASEEITGFAAREVLGREIGDYFPLLRPDSDGLMRPVIELTRKDERTIPVGYSWAKLNMPDRCEDCRIFTFQDLSQIRKMEAQVQQAEKMAAIGEMAAGIAHEFRNPLAAISGAAQVLGQDLDRDPGHKVLMNIIVRECDRLERTIGEFLLFSRPASPEKEWFSLPDLVREVEQLMRQGSTFKESCRLQSEIPEGLECWGDPRQIKQILLNLFQNSCHAMERGGVITVAAREEKEGGRERCRLSVADTGPGIPASLRSRIFEPFFTTRENGTGLGLAIVRQIAESHGGEIKLDSAPPEGACFVVSLPLP